MKPETDRNIITRFPPSPTGFLHIGSVRTALFNYLFAKKLSGNFILRIEDTDRERSTKDFEQDILSGLEWLGLLHDNKEVVRQSERGEVYKKYLKTLVDSGKAYISKEEIKEEGDRSEVIRFKNPNKKITFTDLIRGDITFDTTELGDFVIAKSLTEPLYHLAVVIDDFEAGVTHVIRGEDGISNTPRQILIQEALGASRPIYAHLPLILAEDRSKLSKRKHGERVSLKYYIDQGYLKEVLINFVALLGWNPGGEKEIFDLPELIQLFDISKVQKGGAVFNEEKLRWINKEYVKKMSEEKLIENISAYFPAFKDLSQTQQKKLIPVLTERTSTFGDIRTEAEKGEWAYFFEAPQISKEKLVWKDSNPAETRTHLEYIKNTLEKIDDSHFNAPKLKESVWDYATLKGRGNVLWPLRYSLSGKDKSPDPFTLGDILGKKETLERILKALASLQN